MMKRISTSIYTFQDLIEGEYLYVDKTSYIQRLVEQPKGLYFLARPRRFGKSLLISTLKAYFLGMKTLFVGLDIHNIPYDWHRYPVIHLDLGAKEINNADDLKEYLINRVNKAAAEYSIILSRATPEERFQELIENLALNGDKVVILIDEYDKPILGSIESLNIRDILRTLKAFYSVIKTTEPYQRFVLLTGVSKFSKVSIFSDLNNLDDVSMNTEYATMLGYTQAELEGYFSNNLKNQAEREGVSYELILNKIKRWYNGYRFSEDTTAVYNPVSVMRCLSEKKFSNFWFETGTPTFLLNLMRNQEFNLVQCLEEPKTELAFATYDIEKLSITPLLFQTGYLSIVNSFLEEEIRFYTLGFPNQEVEQAFGAYLIDSYTNLEKDRVGSNLLRLAKYLKSSDLESFFALLHVFFAGIPNTISLKHEKYYQTILFVILHLLGLYIQVEVSTNLGRIDAVLQTKDSIFIFEFKLNGSAEEALNQILTKGYSDPYKERNNKIICVGVEFDPDTRNVGRWLTA